MKRLRVRKTETQPFQTRDGNGTSVHEKVDLLDPEFLHPVESKKRKKAWTAPKNKQTWDWTNFDLITPHEMMDIDNQGYHMGDKPTTKRPTMLFAMREIIHARMSVHAKGLDRGAFIIIWNDTTKEILLARRSAKVNNPGKWNFFGGGVDSGETPVRAAIRELYEEAGLKISSVYLMDLGIVRDGDKQGHYYVLRVTNDKLPIKMNGEHDKLRWFELDDVPNKLNKACRNGLKLFEQNLIELEMR